MSLNRNVVQRLALGSIELYQKSLSPYVGGCCRHQPTCSNYAHEAISRHGVIGGVRLAALRLSRCRPLGSWGYDPVP